jgi:membrane associated rhomboid family serine protease
VATETTPTTCFHHPDRETGRHCTRCGRPACADCLREAAVGAQCFECVKAAAPSTRQRLALRLRGENLLATKAIIGVNVVAFLAIALLDGRIDGGGPTSRNLALYGPDVHNGDWWQLLSSSIVHYGLLHLFFNMLVLWLVGRVLEPGAGALRFTELYVVSVLAGSAGALVVTPHVPTGGASGGVFGVAAAATLVMQRQGIRFWDTGFGPLLVINLLFSFYDTNVSIGGHIGGLIGGALAAEAMLAARRSGQPKLGLLGAAFVGFAAVLVAFAAAAR